MSTTNRIIKLVDGQPRIVEDHWQWVSGPEALEAAPPAASLILPFSLWAQRRRQVPSGICIGPDDDFEDATDFLQAAALVAVEFPSFRDGRGLSVAHLLRTRHGWRGELRAVGDVLRDQLRQMRRCGFDAFAVRADKNLEDAMKGLTPRIIHYQGAADDPVPLFRRRPS